MRPTFTPAPAGDRLAPVGGLLGAALRRPGARRVLSALSVLLLLAGAGLLAIPAVTNVVAHHRQSTLLKAFDDPSTATRYRLHLVKVGESLTRLIIPKLGVDVVVVEGTTPAALRAGAGHYPTTPLPGEPGNVGIAGHRTTYGRPFNRLDEMRPGDVVILGTPIATYTYAAVPAFGGHDNPWPVDPSDTSVVAQDGANHWLTLTTCHPKGSAKQRLVLRLTLVRTGPALKPGQAPPRTTR